MRPLSKFVILFTHALIVGLVRFSGHTVTYLVINRVNAIVSVNTIVCALTLAGLSSGVFSWSRALFGEI